MHARKTHFFQIWPSLYLLPAFLKELHLPKSWDHRRRAVPIWLIELWKTHIRFPIVRIQKEGRESNEIIICQPRIHSFTLILNFLLLWHPNYTKNLFDHLGQISMFVHTCMWVCVWVCGCVCLYVFVCLGRGRIITVVWSK